jgi:hypothetical protein
MGHPKASPAWPRRSKNRASQLVLLSRPKLALTPPVVFSYSRKHALPDGKHASFLDFIQPVRHRVVAARLTSAQPARPRRKGLRALYFALANLMTLFHYLHYGLALILIFIGGKLVAEEVLRKYSNLELPVPVSLGIVGFLLLGSVGASLLWPKKAMA